ncbi:TetR/AcrR family transcriptional regulator [Nocardia sp. CA-135398]|uniref:TetR/AcrR family transcriptional regulator n=1 Tax=Nocardia sp. CA-135398 TaxID=3239977 RepID=UPI003D96BB96
MSAADRRAQLLDVAREIVAADGFAAVSIDRVAREGEVARALVYQQFTDLSGLMTALLDRESAIALAGIGSVDWAGTEDDADQVGRGILAYLHAAPTSWRIILSPPDGGPPDLRDRLELGRAYARAIGARHLSRYAGVTVDPDGATERIMLAALEELARLHLADPQRYPDELVLNYIRSLIAWATHVEASKKPH